MHGWKEHPLKQYKTCTLPKISILFNLLHVLTQKCFNPCFLIFSLKRFVHKQTLKHNFARSVCNMPCFLIQLTAAALKKKIQGRPQDTDQQRTRPKAKAYTDLALIHKTGLFTFKVNEHFATIVWRVQHDLKPYFVFWRRKKQKKKGRESCFAP